jgi:hypothetical protein
VLARRTLLGEPTDDAHAETAALWARRNEYPPIAKILASQNDDGSWAPPARDYQKYGGSLWQVHLLGEMWADGKDPRVQRAAEYAFSRQLPDGSWSASNMRQAGSIPCLTSNVARALARMGWARDERVLAALAHVVGLFESLGMVNCSGAWGYQLNGYCHMLTPKELMLLAEVPRELWPDGAEELRDECVAKLRDKQVFRCLPVESREFGDAVWSAKPAERDGMRERFLAEHPELHYKEKAGWLRFGYPLSYNSDVLEALWALARIGEPPHPEFSAAVDVVRNAADPQMRWKLRNSFNGKMLADIETKSRPSKWLTLRALQVLAWADGDWRDRGASDLREHHRGLDLALGDVPVPAQKPSLLGRCDDRETVLLVEGDGPCRIGPRADEDRPPRGFREQ